MSDGTTEQELRGRIDCVRTQIARLDARRAELVRELDGLIYALKCPAFIVEVQKTRILGNLVADS
jgi:hypothetical protein